MNEKIYQKCDIEGFFKSIKESSLKINPSDFMKQCIKVDITNKQMKLY